MPGFFLLGEARHDSLISSDLRVEQSPWHVRRLRGDEGTHRVLVDLEAPYVLRRDGDRAPVQKVVLAIFRRSSAFVGGGGDRRGGGRDKRGDKA